jgi:thioredoxin reductase
MQATRTVDVVIVGGGPAGLSAALALGRACKRVLLCDRGEPRNARAREVHNFLSRDGVSPGELRALGRADLGRYETVECMERAVVGAVRGEAGFTVSLDDGSEVIADRILIASGVIDEPPAIPGAEQLWGRTIVQCPYCHGWEARGQRWGVLLPSEAMAEWPLLFLSWTPHVTVFTSGLALSEEAASRLRAAGLRLETAPIEQLIAREGDPTQIAAIRLRSGEPIACDLLFAVPTQRPAPIVTQLGLALDGPSAARASDRRESSVPGVYVAGDAGSPMQGAILAASAGTMAAAMLNHELTVARATRPADR